tara:strand:+ start:121 stop:258 length:138 start_codon:yes stop_codon:yes gene_type:complete
MIVFFIWLFGVIAWNYGVPGATPLQDVILAVILSFISILLKKYIK